MSRELAVLILDEVLASRRALPRSAGFNAVERYPDMTRDDIVRLAAELVALVEHLDSSKAAARAAEIRRMLERDDDDVMRRPFAGRAG